MQNAADPAFSKQSLRITSKYNLKVNGDVDVTGLVIEANRWQDGINPKIRIMTGVNGSAYDTVLIMKLAEFLDALGITKGDINGASDKEAVAGEQAAD